MNQFKHAKWWRSYLDKLWQSFWKLKFMKKPSFGASYSFALVVQSMQGEKQGEEENRVKKTAAVFFRTFEALSEVHFLHTIYHLKS